MMSDRIEGFIDRLVASSDRANALKNLSKWMQKNLRLDGRRYSFKDHEMQKDIASDLHPRMVVKKCSQVGLTELSLRLTAAIARVTRSRIIYILPSARFSEKVSADRFYPILRDSPALRTLLSKEAKSAAMRRIGNSTVYFQGASGTSQAISIPATHLIIDEENFCDPVILGQFNSRLRHAPEDVATGLRGIIKRFSTPTIPKYGVSKHLEVSDKKGYQVCCSKCNTWQLPDYYKDFVVPGYDDDIASFTAAELDNKSYRVDEAYVKCQKCGHDLWQDLLNPERRQWVAECPDVTEMSGYSISPIDVPRYNSIPSLFRQLRGYTVQDHRNFVLGLDYEDRNNSFLTSIFSQHDGASWIPPKHAKYMTLSNIRIGIDVGKTCHIIVGKKVAEKQMDVIWAGTVSQSPGNTLVSQLQEIIDAYNPAKAVIDAGPDFSTSQALVDGNYYGTVFACEYRRTIRGTFSKIEPVEEEGVVKADRSATLTSLMAGHNGGHINYPSLEAHEEVAEIKNHLKVTKKITVTTELGDVVTYPKPSEPDHYAHAMNYMNIADMLLSDFDLVGEGVGMLPTISGVRIGTNHE